MVPILIRYYRASGRPWARDGEMEGSFEGVHNFILVGRLYKWRRAPWTAEL